MITWNQNTRYIATVNHGWAKANTAAKALSAAKRNGLYNKQHLIYAYETECGDTDFSDGVSVDSISGAVKWDTDKVDNVELIEKVGFRLTKTDSSIL